MAGTRLDAAGTAEVDDVVVEAPGLEGTVRVERVPEGAGRRGARGPAGIPRPAALAKALASAGMHTELAVVIDDARDVGGGPGSPRGTTRGARGSRRRAKPPAMTVRVPAPPRGHEQVVMARDEHGIITWHFRKRAPAGATARGGPKTRTYVIDRRTVDPGRTARGTRARGGIPGLAKIIEVLTFPVAEAVGQAARFAAREWDRTNHPPQVRLYGTRGELTALDDAGWAKLEDGPALLFVHGTFSTTQGGFGRLPAATRDELAKRYEGRVIAYDHPTIADDPVENARAFLELAGDRTLELDIVCHSRGGLVTRAIAERTGALRDRAPGVSVRNVILVGVPSNGTILASAKHWNELVDRATTLFSLIPGPGVAEGLEIVFALVRSIAVRTASNLKGLEAMAPGSDFLASLNVETATPASYRAIVSDYEPREPGLREWLDDSVRDVIFGRDEPNDMMVAIASMTGDNGSSRFPVTTVTRFMPGDGVEHAQYFGHALTQQALLDGLPG